MKKLIAVILLCVSVGAMAQHRHHGHHHHGHGSWGWVAPALIGGAIVYGATRPVPQPPPTVIYQSQPLPPAPFGYHYEQILDANCNCYRWVLVQG